MTSLSRITAAALLVWLGFLFYASTVLVRIHQSNVAPESVSEDTLMQRLTIALQELDELKEQNEKLKTWLDAKFSKKDDLKDLKDSGYASSIIVGHHVTSNELGHYSRQHEDLRRSLTNGIVEFWYSLSGKMKILKESITSPSGAVDQIVKSLEEQHRSVLADALKLAEVDKAGEWRRSQLKNLTALVQLRLDFLQNPPDCKTARKLVCNLNKGYLRSKLWMGPFCSYIKYVSSAAERNGPHLQFLSIVSPTEACRLVPYFYDLQQVNVKFAYVYFCAVPGCGFGCQIHHASYCFVMAYATNRTLILNAHGWRYSQKGWDSVFMPLSRTCLEGAESDAQSWRGLEEQRDVQSISVPIIDSLRPRIPQLPLSFPKDLADKLLLLHSNPPVWWVAQFVWYLMRYQPTLHSDLHSAAQKLKFKGPIVGIHVRRTDKVGSEAAFHSIEEYMMYAEAWFNLQQMKNGTENVVKRVYLATDEPSLIDETRRKYPAYQVLADASIAASAQLNSRYSDSSLRGVIADVHFLARCDYLVCTFSSQVCRIAYELMQIVKGDDVADSFKSLDDIYYFGGQEGHEQVAVLSHSPQNGRPDEMELRAGDTLGIAGNHWDGYSKGRNGRTGQTGLYPSYKAKEKWRIADFPIYQTKIKERAKAHDF